MSLVLASASPRRAELLHQLNLDFRTISTDVDESVLAGESATVYVERVTELKASAAAKLCATDDVIITADTTVTVGEQILGKPQSKKQCINMLMSLSGKQHQVLTALMLTQGQSRMKRLSVTDVSFREISLAEAEHYWQTGEPKGKAGAYAIQGLGAMFVAIIVGSYTGVMGLPLFELTQLLANFNIQILSNNRKK